MNRRTSIVAVAFLTAAACLSGCKLASLIGPKTEPASGIVVPVDGYADFGNGIRVKAESDEKGLSRVIIGYPDAKQNSVYFIRGQVCVDDNCGIVVERAK